MQANSIPKNTDSQLKVDGTWETTGDASMQTPELDAEIFIRNTFEDDPKKGCELIFRLYYRSLCTHAVRYVYSKEIAEDLVADVFYTFWNTRAFLSVKYSYRSFLFRSVRNRSYNYLMNEMKKTDSLESATEYETPFSDRPETIMQFEELSHKVEELVAALPAQCQKIFLMNRFEGKKCRDIAQELHLSVRTVEVHVAKALAVLRQGLKDQWIGAALLFGFSSIL